MLIDQARRGKNDIYNILLFQARFVRNGYRLQGPKNFKIHTRPPAILHSSYNKTKKDNPLALTKIFLVRTSRQVDSLDSGLSTLYNTTPKKKASENIVGNREDDGNQHFLLF